MVSTENSRVRQLLEDFVAALTPTDHEPTLEELRETCDQWMTMNVPAPKPISGLHLRSSAGSAT